MLVIRRNQNNKMVVSVSRDKTLASPNYLFSFQHILSKEQVQFFPKNISTSVDRYDEFEFNEGQEPSGYSGDVPYEIFPYPGQYYYSIYETFTTNSTDPKYAFDKLEEGRAIIEDSSIPDPYSFTYTSSNENNSNYIYYKPGTNEVRPLVRFNPTYFNSRQSVFSWSYKYPNIYVKDLTTNVVEEIPMRLYNQTGICDTYENASGSTYYKEITTGDTWNGFKMYMDTTELISYGYDYDGDSVVGGITRALSGITYSNFRQGFIPPLWAVDTIEHYNDGSNITGTASWNKTLGLSVFVSDITGNTITPYTINDQLFSGSTFNEVCSDYYAGTSVSDKIWFKTTAEKLWYINTGDTSNYSMTECVFTPPTTNFFVGKFIFDDGLVYVGSANTSGQLVYVGTCIPPTPTPTPTSTITPTPTLTPTNTPTQTITPSITPSLTPSLTPSITPTLTPTNTPTSTTTPTPTITSTNTPTPSITPTLTGTPTPTPTITPSATSITYNLLAENSDDLLTESSDNLRREQNI